MKNEIGAGWIKEGKSGGKYIAIKLGNGKWINLWKNDYKKADRHPDYRLTTNDEELLEMFGKQDDAPISKATDSMDDVPF